MNHILHPLAIYKNRGMDQGLCNSRALVLFSELSAMALLLNNASFRLCSTDVDRTLLRRQAAALPNHLALPALGISETFCNLKKRGKVAFIPYITAGDPNISTTAKALKLLDHCGADVIELGVPCTDPFADGPVIQDSHRRALAGGATFQAIMSMLEEVIPQLSCPIALLSYYNPLLKYSVKRFMSTIKHSGVQGLLVPDLPFETIVHVKDEATRKNIDLVMFTTPATPVNQMKAIANASEGFIYLASSNGVTGVRPNVDPKVQFLIEDIKEETSKPVAVGFGISKPEHVEQISRWGADGVIVGSAIVKILGEANSIEEGLMHVETFIRPLRDVLA